MIKVLFLYFVLFLCALSSSGQQLPGKNLGIIPAPASVAVNTGFFNIDKITAIVYSRDSGKKEAQLLHDFLLQNYKLEIPVSNKIKGGQNNTVVFSPADNSITGEEAYRLSISNDDILIKGDEAGLFYGLQSLIQVIQAGNGNIPCAVIADEPRYSYRGIMQDVGYHIFPVDFIKKQLDIMAKYKLNTYHWHLTEDHGWRIQIMKYPRLTEVGSVRAQSPVNNYNDEMSGLDGIPYGGYYTQAQIKDIVAYATERHITIIPEIELPGHSLAALAAYPELACGDKPGPFKVAENWGIYDDVYCAGKEHTFDFLQDVLSEVISLFPGKYIHIGGDECPKDRWEKCKYCQKRIKDNHLKNEHELQSYFIRRIEKFVNSKGRSIIGWDEILEGGLAPNATVMSWRGIKGGIAAAKQGNDVVMASESHIYFDFIQGPREQEPLAIGVGYNPLSRVYSFNPTPGDLTPNEQKHIIGIEAPLWTEHMEIAANVEYMLYPRMFALAEISWTPLNRKDYGDFAEQRLPKHLAILDKTATVYRVPTPIGQTDTTLWGKEFTVALKAPVEGASIYYNFEGQEPRESDYLYAGPIHVKVPEGEVRQLKTVVVTPAGRRSIVTTTLFANKAFIAPEKVDDKLLKPGIKYYDVPGKYALVDMIDAGKAAKTGMLTELGLQKFDDDAEHNIIYKGYIDIKEDDIYTFSMPSKGAEVKIDNLPGVSNSNIYNYFDLENYHYQEKAVSYGLKKGLHAIQIRYIPSDAGYRVRVRPSKGEFSNMDGMLYTAD